MWNIRIKSPFHTTVIPGKFLVGLKSPGIFPGVHEKLVLAIACNTEGGILCHLGQFRAFLFICLFCLFIY